jgi:hypothetical protein
LTRVIGFVVAGIAASPGGRRPGIALAPARGRPVDGLLPRLAAVTIGKSATCGMMPHDGSKPGAAIRAVKAMFSAASMW